MPAFVIYIHRGQFSSVNNMKKKNFAVDTFNGWSLNSIVDGILMGCTLSFWLHFNYGRASDAANWISEWANEEHLIIFAGQITVNIRVCSWWFQFYSFLPSGITVAREVLWICRFVSHSSDGGQVRNQLGSIKFLTWSLPSLLRTSASKLQI